MASLGHSNDARKLGSSNKPKGRENARNILCKNKSLYGVCRVNACPYQHDSSKLDNARHVSGSNADFQKAFLNVDSPSFTPLGPALTNNNTAVANKLGISPKAAAAAVFTPKASAAKPVTPSVAAGIPEFVPQNQRSDDTAYQEFSTSSNHQNQHFDPFNADDHATAAALPQLNPYAQDGPSSLFPPATNTFTHPLNYHLYAPVGPHRENLLPYQRTVHNLFISDHLREELQRKAEATLQTFANSTLPAQVDHFHSLVLLDTNIQKAPSESGYITRLYKAVSTKDGHTYCLRRLEGFRLTDEKAVSTIQIWKRINHANVVTVHDAFTTRAFGDSSLIVVTDYHPLSQALADRLPAVSTRQNGRQPTNTITLPELWSYLVQLSSALKTIHSNGLAARLVTPAKVLSTSKGRVRLNTCGVLDIALYDPAQQSVAALQAQDLVQLGQTFLCLATKSASAHKDPTSSLNQITNNCGDKMRQALMYLLTPAPADSANAHTIESFLTTISEQALTTLDASLHEADTLTSTLHRELENDRLVRLLTKLNLILERPATPLGPSNTAAQQNASTAWSETGERYYLKLFRDYVFHAVDPDGRPVLDLGHVLAALNKFDAGIDERVLLVSRDEQNCFVVSFRELKRGFESAWAELVKASNGTRRL